MRTLASIIALFFMTLALSGCGGDSGCGHVTGGGTTTGTTSTCGTTNTPPPPAANVASLTVTSSAASIPADGSSPATITVLAKDANNTAMSGVAVTLAASGGTLSGAKPTTDANGVITANLAGTGVAAGQTITVTATSGSATGKVTISVVATQQNITLLTNSQQMPSDNSKPTTITAIVQGANNQLLAGVPVTFQASSGAIVAAQTTAGGSTVPAGTTDSNGQAQATLTTPGDPTNRTITVTAVLGSGATQATVAVQVVGTKIAVTGPTSLIVGNSGSFSVALTDSGGNGIAGQTITLTSAAGNTLGSKTVVTDSTGHGTFQLTAAVAGNDTISATALGLLGTAAVAVSGQDFSFTAPTTNSTVAISTAQPVTLVWKNNGTAVTGTNVTFSTTRGTFNGTAATTIILPTDGTGTVTGLTISSTTAGPAVISASATGVSAQVPITFVSTSPASITVQASPATIPTQGQATISAVVRDANNNLVQGQTVDFQLTDKTGGQISAATAVTDVQGQAQTVYTATSTASTASGVTVTAVVHNSTTNTDISGSTTLTVGGQTVFLSLGTGNVVSTNAADTSFLLPYYVQALDSAGHAVPGVQISFTVHSLPPAGGTSDPANGYTTDAAHFAYAKGQWFNTGGTPPWVQYGSYTVTTNPGPPPTTTITATPITKCLNEDVAGTGIFSAGEDLNGNGKLDPGDVAAVSPGTLVTDSTGSGNLTISYPEDHAAWVQVVLTATATVNGTQSTTSATFVLPMLASKISNASAAPPGAKSPYGDATSCADPN